MISCQVGAYSDIWRAAYRRLAQPRYAAVLRDAGEDRELPGLTGLLLQQRRLELGDAQPGLSVHQVSRIVGRRLPHQTGSRDVLPRRLATAGRATPPLHDLTPADGGVSAGAHASPATALVVVVRRRTERRRP